MPRLSFWSKRVRNISSFHVLPGSTAGLHILTYPRTLKFDPKLILLRKKLISLPENASSVEDDQGIGKLQTPKTIQFYGEF